jgi:hypothetical protein
MKILKASFLATLVLLLVVGLSSCNTDSSTVAPTDNSSDLTLIDNTASPSEVIDATLDQPMQMRPPFDDRGGRDMGERKMFNPLFRVIQAMKLTPEQMEQFRALLKQRNDCITEALKILRESEKAILEGYKAEYKALYEQVKAGEITREEFRAQIRELNQEVRTALQENPVRERVMAMIKNCDEEFNSAVESILDETQLAIWKKFWENFKNRVGTGPGK